MSQIAARIGEALELHQHGQLMRAEQIYREVLAIRPDHAVALHLLGVVAAQTKNPQQAVDLITRAIAIDPNNAMMHFNRATALQELGQLPAALASYDRALAIDGNLAEAYSNRAVVLMNLQEFRAALDSCDRAIAIKTEFAEAHFNRGNALQGMSEWSEALVSYDRAIAVKPGYASAYFNRGNVLKELNRWEDALASYDRAIAVRNNYVQAHSNRASVLKELERWEAALASYDLAIALQPNDPLNYFNRANVLREMGQLQAALASHERAIAIKPNFAEAYSGRGIVLKELNHLNAALASCDRAIELDPTLEGAYLNRGVVLYAHNRREAALADYERAIAINPNIAKAFSNRAVIQRDLKQPGAALESCEQALKIKPDLAEALFNRAMALRDLKRYDACIEALDRMIPLKSSINGVHGLRLNVKMQICDWDQLSEDVNGICKRIERGEPAAPPFTLLAPMDSPALQKSAAETWVRAEHGPSTELPTIRRYERHDKIRIGYFSSDYYNHATMYLMAGLFESHDRTKFEITAFSFGPNPADEMRKRLEAACEVIDVHDKSDREVAIVARDLQIDIAVDLKGLTQDSRPGIFALRAAPLQVSYLGYPGTTGAEYIDYLIADRTLIPTESMQYYREKIIFLPDSYQVNDARRAISARTFTREELGLPPAAFVYCCFNSPYKITPATFASWMWILSRIEGSVLWLIEDNSIAVKNLRGQAEARGVDPERLIFAARTPLPEHLSRHRAADLFLDTLPCNAHTTASDALWAGLPVLTLAGESFASRVSASLLRSLGLAELVANSQQQYEELAVLLATDAKRLADVKEKLADHRLAAPLFDTQLFTKRLEDAYSTIFARHEAGLPPEHI
jgi:predicted O-linked N-acetylglucosamine transferase (SPINDLY family)